MPDHQEQLADAFTAYRAGRLEEARGIATAMLQQTPHAGALWELLGFVERDAGNAEASVSAFEQASVLIPLQMNARVCLAEGYGNIGKRELARDLFLEFLRTPALDVATILQIAAGLDGCDYPGFAMKACRLAQQRDAEHPQTYYDMGFYAARSGYPLRVVESLARRAISLAPERLNFRVGLASLLMRNGRDGDALDVLRPISERHIADVRCRCCLERIIELFERTNEQARIAACREQLARLGDSDGEAECR